MEANHFTHHHHHHHHFYTLKPSSFLILNQPFTTQLSLHRTRRSLQILKVTPPATSNNDSSREDGNTLPPPPPTVTPISDTVEIRFRRRSRKRQKQEELDNLGGKPTKPPPPPPPPPKDWEDMTFQEKALELYVGEKGLLFWLNKFAYASIYIIIGAWIIFRFVGPSLGLYQLDTPPLSPTSILKG